MDKRIKEEGEGATLEEGSQELVVAQVRPSSESSTSVKYYKISQATVPSSTLALNPHGMAVLAKPHTLAYSRLCLEADLGWTGRPRLLTAGYQMPGQVLG